MTDRRRRLLAAIGQKGADTAQLTERLADWSAGALEGELAAARADNDVRTHVIELNETGPPSLPVVVYLLTPQGAGKVGVDPDRIGLV